MAQTYKIFQKIGLDGNNQPVYKELFNFTIDVSNPEDYSDYEWDSKTGLVTALDSNGNRVVLPTTGNTIGRIPPCEFKTEGLISIDYNYQYY